MADKDFWTEIDQYYLDLLTKPDPRLGKILQNSMDAGLPAINISPSHGRFFEILVRSLHVKRILEIGTLGGYSTAWLARSLPTDGKLISLEVNPDHAALARENLSLFDFGQLIEIRIGEAVELMKEMVESTEDPFDMVFIDGEKSQYPVYLEFVLPLCRPGTLLIADNVVKHGRVFNKNIDTPSRVGITTFHEKVATDPRLQAAVLQTVGEKGHDGYVFITYDPI
ncbi:MAG: O-methyltransferase [Anaerolineales bacterium]|nr:O-methyltransferase [Anaerolineales bacterium]